MKCELLGLFFSADVTVSAAPHFCTDRVEVMEKEFGTERGHCSPCGKKFARQSLQTYLEHLPSQYFINMLLGTLL